MHSVKVLILADDFTGAMDTAVQLSKRGVRTVVCTHAEADIFKDGLAGFTESDDGKVIEAISVNINCRHISPEDAFLQIKKVLSFYADIPYIYLKTDSVLRGNLSALFASALDVLKTDIFFAPAYPQVERTTINGHQMDRGIPIDQTSFAEDPLNPIKNSYIPEILNQDYFIPAELLPVINESTEIDFSRNGSKHHQVYAFDAGCELDLHRIAGVLMVQDKLKVCAGCAGFMDVLANVLFTEQEIVVQSSAMQNLQNTKEPVVYLSCSAQPITRRQIAYARSHGFPVEKIPKHLLSGCKSEKIEHLAEDVGLRLEDYLMQGRSVILASNTDDEDFIQTVGDDFHDCLLQFLGAVTEKLVSSGYRKIAVFGGDGAYAIMKKLGCECIFLGKEIQPGVPLSKLGIIPPVEMVTKSGGLGEDHVVLAIENAMRG